MRQLRGEMYRVLTGAAADFQDLSAFGEADAQHLEYRILVAFACFGEGHEH